VARGGAAAIGATYMPTEMVLWYWTPSVGTVPLSRVIEVPALECEWPLGGLLGMSDDGTSVMGFTKEYWWSTIDTMWIATVSAGGCTSADYNGDGEYGDDADIEAFFACLAGRCCLKCINTDVNVDSVTDNADTEAFFRALASGEC
jgi:hypothetical protein